ncbi:uncharacterized protein N0V89_001904 [Didymosphaeria variabile]|uniref:Uncharacterized protein n=1 Tax=Didymosphaeria variabile TaxID=1932322 RepID=A0A9W8XRS6_9PLEO|nr:uncharacterized protein N0V89_001904 [Didymosphaeria variabile]KAJ4357329.1 hypothetical protein N0V89_001904 [Didymosphaeria variabile]
MAEAANVGTGSDISKSFNWLSRNRRGIAYISYSQFSHLSATSFEFGSRGYAARCNYGGELLNLSSLSPQHGLIFANGDFSPSLHASIARGQLETGGPSTFGLKVSMDQPPYHPSLLFGNKAGSHFRLGNMLERGSFNYRWPFNEYALLLNEDSRDDMDKDRWKVIKDKMLVQKRKEWNAERKSPEEIIQHELEVVDEVDRVFMQEKVYDEEKRKLSNERMSEKEIERILASKEEIMANEVKERLKKAKQNRKHGVAGEVSGTEKETGTCVMFSFIKDGILYQVVRIEQDFWSAADPSTCHIFPDDAHIVLTVGGPVQFRHFGPNPAVSGLYCHADKPSKQPCKSEPPLTTSLGPCEKIMYTDEEIKLEARVYQLNTNAEVEKYEELLLIPSKSDGDNGVEACGMTAYHAICKLSTRNGPIKKKNATFVASFCLSESSTSPKPWPAVPPSSEEIFNYVGANPKDKLSRKSATGAMWDTIFLKHYLRSNSLSPLAEVHLIGRCLEKIIHVDILPIHHSSTQKSERCDALVSNIFIKATVDYRALFWKIRFLIKVHLFLGRVIQHSLQVSKSTNDDGRSGNHSASLSDLDPVDKETMRDIAAEQQRRIQNRIEGVVRFLVLALREPNSSPFTNVDNSGDMSNYYYMMITLWYSIRNFSSEKPSTPTSLCSEQPSFHWERSLMQGLGEKAEHAAHLPNNDENFGMVNKDKIPLLQWYQYGSILELCRLGYLPPIWNRQDRLPRRVHQLRNAALVASAAKYSSRSPYSANDEIVDRLAFLGYELGLEEGLDRNSHTVASFARKRVKERDFTRTINPGWLPAEGDGSIDGPWEVNALCHHSRLMVVNLEYDQPMAKSSDWRSEDQREEEVELYKGKLFHFINSEATLVPCWDRSHLRARKGWAHSEATSVLGSTLLDIHKQVFKDPLSGMKPSGSPRSYNDGTKKVVQEMWFIETLMSKQTKMLERTTPEAGLAPPIEWAQTWRPPREYHPETFIHSLEDTPHLYRHPYIGRVKLPHSLREYVLLPKEVPAEGFNKGHLQSMGDLRYIYLADILSNGDNIEYAGLTPGATTVRINGQIAVRRGGQEELVRRLQDSLVDLDVRHRFLRAKETGSNRPTKVLEEPKDETWSWCPPRITRKGRDLEAQRESSGGTRPSLPYQYRKEFMDDEPISLLAHFDKLVDTIGDDPKAKHRHELRIACFELQVSSFVLATNSFGDFSKCTIISQLIDQPKLREISEEARNLYRIFIHQPQTARCLVFLLVLGKINGEIAQQYEKAVNVVSSILNLEKCFSEEVETWPEDKEAVRQFQLGLWSLESLYKLQYSLKLSLDSIVEARDKLTGEVKEGCRSRSEPLERLCQESQDTFENSLTQLTAVASKLAQDIELNSRYKDAVTLTKLFSCPA